MREVKVGLQKRGLQDVPAWLDEEGPAEVVVVTEVGLVADVVVLQPESVAELQGALDLAAAKQAIKEKGYTCTGVKG